MNTKQHYNMHLSRYKKAIIYLNRKDVSIAEQNKWVPEIKKITDKLSKILESIENYTIDEALDGFGFEEELK